ncbi:MAG: hypothetical protein M3373_07385 [Gemmatimonadota bacterium]|nr:hypothetical protein [Gemmatimonadota bacterium]
MIVFRLIPPVAFGLLVLAGCSGDSGPGPDPGNSCGAGGLTLGLGEVRVLQGADRSELCLNGGSAGADFTLIPVHTDTGSANRQLEVIGDGIVAVAATPNPFEAPASGGPSLSRAAHAAELTPDRAVHARLRAMERRELGARLGRARRTIAPSRALTPDSPSRAVSQVGDRLDLNVAQIGCATSSIDNRAGVVKAVTQRAVIVADEANPSGGFTDAEYLAIGNDFDTDVWPVITSNFGTPEDIDENDGRVVIFFTRAVNELTESGSSSYVGGFFHPRDLFPRTHADPNFACDGSNEAEMFYMLVPDPNGEVNNNKRDKNFVQRITLGVIAHEFQHLINGSLKVENPDASDFEETWLNEGLSHIAEELMFYHASGLSPRGNLTLEDIRASAQRVDAFNAYQTSNFGRLDEYLPDPEGQSPWADDDDLATRGATWQMLRYLADRKGGSESSFWRALVSSTRTGVDNLNRESGINHIDAIRDWAISVYADDAVSGVPAKYTQPSWNFRSVYLGFQNHGPYRLKVRKLADNTSTLVSLTGGGAAFVRFGVPASDMSTISIKSQGSAPPGNFQLGILRTR